VAGLASCNPFQLILLLAFAGSSIHSSQIDGKPFFNDKKQDTLRDNFGSLDYPDHLQIELLRRGPDHLEPRRRRFAPRTKDGAIPDKCQSTRGAQ
jgi:hypothetical protein